MKKKLDGYMSLEMSFIVPILISLFYMIVILGITLFSNCVKSQNQFIDGLRNSRLTYKEGTYGEVIYNELENVVVNVKYVEGINPVKNIRKERE